MADRMRVTSAIDPESSSRNPHRQSKRTSDYPRVSLEPEELATDAIADLEGGVEELNAGLTLLENGEKG